MQQYQFPQGFLWGAAASGPQTEGVTNKRHRSIWDNGLPNSRSDFISR